MWSTCDQHGRSWIYNLRDIGRFCPIYLKFGRLCALGLAGSHTELRNIWMNWFQNYSDSEWKANRWLNKILKGKGNSSLCIHISEAGEAGWKIYKNLHWLPTASSSSLLEPALTTISNHLTTTKIKSSAKFRFNLNYVLAPKKMLSPLQQNYSC